MFVVDILSDGQHLSGEKQTRAFYVLKLKMFIEGLNSLHKNNLLQHRKEFVMCLNCLSCAPPHTSYKNIKNTDRQQQTTGRSGQSDLEEYIQHEGQSAEVK